MTGGGLIPPNEAITGNPVRNTNLDFPPRTATSGHVPLGHPPAAPVNSGANGLPPGAVVRQGNNTPPGSNMPPGSNQPPGSGAGTAAALAAALALPRVVAFMHARAKLQQMGHLYPDNQRDRHRHSLQTPHLILGVLNLQDPLCCCLAKKACLDESRLDHSHHACGDLSVQRLDSHLRQS